MVYYKTNFHVLVLSYSAPLATIIEGTVNIDFELSPCCHI